jgi:hypothetical protein
MEDEILSIIELFALAGVLMFSFVILEDVFRQWLRQRKFPSAFPQNLTRPSEADRETKETVSEKESSIVTRTNRPLWPKN